MTQPSCHDDDAAPKSLPPRSQGSVLVAFVGRPNAGKSSLYNNVTGGHAHVGNYPGITVDVLESEVTLPSGRVVTIADLPGLYSLDAALDPATDEGIAVAFLQRAREEHGKVIVVQVIDGTRLPLGLRLCRELSAKDQSLVLAITQRDLLDAEGTRISTELIEDAVHAPVALVSARHKGAKDEVLRIIDRALAEERTASDAFDADDLARRATSRQEARGPSFSARADAWLLHPALGPLLFLGLMTLLFAGVFLVADPAKTLMDALVDAGRTRATRLLGTGVLGSFVSDGLLAGAGTVIAFMPQIVLLTVGMELLEASGYLARGAFLVDRVLRVMGLSGRAFLPLLMGHACAVPALGATRVIRDPRERLTTILVLPLMTCSARIPLYALVIQTFFAHRGALFRSLVFVTLYALGILSGLIASLVLRRTATKGRALPLVLEIPSLRSPSFVAVARKARQAASRFVRDVGTTILVSSAALWLLLSVKMPGTAPLAEGARPIEGSIAAYMGKALEPVTKPAGFDWRVNVGLIGSFGARELMVSTMGVISGIENADDDPAPLASKLREAKDSAGKPVYTARTGLALLAFFVIACQCMSTLAAVRRETKSLRWPVFVFAYTYAAGYVAALLTYHLSGLFGMV